MKKSKGIILISYFLIALCIRLAGQNTEENYRYTAADAIYTTYAAPLSRSEYSSDQAYELQWTNPDKPLGFTSKSGGETGMVFSLGQKLVTGPGTYYTEPVITRSYSDIVCLEYKPFRDIEVKAIFCVYSSNLSIYEYSIRNLSGKELALEVYPYVMVPHGIEKIEYEKQGVGFQHSFMRDQWMQEHNIPVAEHFINQFLLNETPEGFLLFDGFPANTEILSSWPAKENKSTRHAGIMMKKLLLLKPGEIKSVTISRDVSPKDGKTRKSELLQFDAAKVLHENEILYSRIPKLPENKVLSQISHKDLTGLYQSAFTLMRQCMMPAEGQCGYNYYVFSREPKWGWGYGGQVFHESLAMLAYVYMDPQGAMNSQRVFMERQQSDGYINYRTGPYLNETIETQGLKTSSAPWFSYTNYEIYKITKDKKFLLEAYESGRKLYDWFVRNRDKDEDGLFEWGGNATLECVRDGLVAAWDKVSKPENLEGPDLNSMMVKEAMSLAHMAKELKMDSDSRRYFELAKKTARKINQQLWDQNTMFYYNTLLSTNTFTFLETDDLKIKEITGFLPLWANVCSKEQADQILRSLYNPEEFWRPYGVPTLSAKDNYYNPMGYWNGPVWIQWQYLLFRGLKDYGYDRLANQLVSRVAEQMIWHLKNDHTFWEFYSPDDRQAGWNRTYIWAGIIARMIMETR